MTEGTLSITTDPYPLSVSILDQNLKLVKQTVSPASGIKLPEGLYYVQASRPFEPDLTAVARVTGSASRTIHLAVDAPSVLRRIRPAYAFRNAEVETLASTMTPVASEPAPSLEPLWIRFAWLYDWSTAQVVRPPATTTSFAPGQAILTVTNHYPRVVFAQIATRNRMPVNVALPPAGLSGPVRCDLTISQSPTQISTHVSLSTGWADAALQYMAQGYREQAQRVVEMAARDQPFGRFSWSSRLEDPSAALVERYLQVRTAKPDVPNSAVGKLLDSVTGSSDGLILSAELAARDGEDSVAARKLLRIRQGALPLFTEGFSLLVNRLRALLEEDDNERLRALRKQILRWTPYVELANATLTFPGEDLASPRLGQGAGEWQEKDGWVQLKESRPLSFAVPSAIPVPAPVTVETSGEFSRLFTAPPAMPVPAPARPQDSTKIFTVPPALPVPAPIAVEPGEFTRLFTAPSAIPAPTPMAVKTSGENIPTDLLLRIDRLTAACIQRYRFYRLLENGLSISALAASFGVIAAGVYHQPARATLLGAITGALFSLHRSMQFEQRAVRYRLLISEIRILATRAKNGRIPTRQFILGLNELIRRQASV